MTAPALAEERDVQKHVPALKEDGEELELALEPSFDIECVLRWHSVEGQPAADLDACAVCVGPDGRVVDAASRNHRSACDGCVVHRGDGRSSDGGTKANCKVLALNLNKLPYSGCCTVLICVFAHKGGSLESIDGIVAHVRRKAPGLPRGGHERATQARIIVLGSTGTGVAFAALYSTTRGKSWRLKRMCVPLPGLNFMEVTDIIRQAALEADVVCSVPGGSVTVCLDRTFYMNKGDKALVPFKEVFLGLGWKCNADMDLDAAIVLQNHHGGLHSAVFYNNKAFDTHIVHLGHKLAGENGDDETIQVNLGTMPGNIAVLYVIVNIYSSGRSFREVNEPYVRLCEKDGHTLSVFALDASLSSQGVVFCSLARHQDKWRMEALGIPCSGRTVLDPGTLEACGFRRVRTRHASTSRGR